VLQVGNNPADEIFMITIFAVSRRRGSGWIDRRIDESLCLPTATVQKSRLSGSTRRTAADSPLHRHRAQDDAGFTLIELMVVLLILAILLAIAIPTFLGVTKSANDRAAQSNLDSALVNAKSIFQTNNQSYLLTTNATYPTPSGVMANSLYGVVPNLTFTTAAVSSGNAQSASAVSVAVSTDGTGLALAEQAKGTGNCWFIVDNSSGTAASPETWGLATGSTTSGPITTGTWYGEAKAATTCSAAAIPAYSSGSVVWSQGAFPNL
jgi:type IV pilus assembly protein PilA